MKEWKARYAEKKPWLWQNLRYLPVMLLFALPVTIASLATYNEEMTVGKLIEDITSNLTIFLFMPLITVNVIYILASGRFIPIPNTTVHFIYRIIGLLLGVLVGTAMLFASSLWLRPTIDGTEAGNDFTVMLENQEIQPFWVLYISFVVVGLFIGIPNFLRVTREKETELKLKSQEVQLSQLQQLKTKAELQSLQARINPHFLYNALNSIASLVHEDPDNAEKMVLLLSDLFRYSLNTKDEDFTDLQTEMNMASTYLQIEKIRFGENLSYDIEIEESCQSRQIPRFLIQPLVENAVKHGTSKVQKGHIKVSVGCKDNEMQINVHDNGPDFPDGLNPNYGLKSTMGKLNLLFPNRYELEFFNGADKRVSITLKQ